MKITASGGEWLGTYMATVHFALNNILYGDYSRDANPVGVTITVDRDGELPALIAADPDKAFEVTATAVEPGRITFLLNGEQYTMDISDLTSVDIP